MAYLKGFYAKGFFFAKGIDTYDARPTALVHGVYRNGIFKGRYATTHGDRGVLWGRAVGGELKGRWQEERCGPNPNGQPYPGPEGQPYPGPEGQPYPGPNDNGQPVPNNGEGHYGPDGQYYPGPSEGGNDDGDYGPNGGPNGRPNGGPNGGPNPDGKFNPAPHQPKCKTFVLGDDTSCKSESKWAKYGHQLCSKGGAHLEHFSLGYACGKGRFERVKLSCCR